MPQQQQQTEEDILKQYGGTLSDQQVNDLLGQYGATLENAPIPDPRLFENPKNPYAYTTPSGIPVYQAAPVLPEAERPKQPPPEGTFLHEAFTVPGKQAASGFMSSAAGASHLTANIAGLLDVAAESIAKLTGTEKGGLFKHIEDWARGQQAAQEKTAAELTEGRQDLASQLYRAPAQAITSIPTYGVATALGGPVGGMAMLGALETADQGWKNMLMGAAGGAASGGALHVMGPAGRPIRIMGAAAMTYAQLRLAGVDHQTALAQALTMGGMAGLGPGGGPGLREMAGNIPTPRLPGVTNVLTPEERANQAWLTARGIQTPLSMQTGSKAAAALEGTTQNLPGGGKFAETMQAQKERLTGPVAQELVQGIHPESLTPEESGAAVQQTIGRGLEQARTGLAEEVAPGGTVTPEAAGTQTLEAGKAAIRGKHELANQSYRRAWQAEQDPRNIAEVPTGETDTEGNPVTEQMALPIDMGPVQAALKPLLARYEYTLTQTERSNSPGVNIMRQIVGGKRYKPASAAELDLGMLKEAARTEKGLVELRDVSQGLAARAVAELQGEIDAKMASAEHPDGQGAALEHLRAGRKATAEKHDIEDVFREFGPNINEVEPVGAYRRMIWEGDSGIRHLRQVAEIAPDAMPAVGRAFIDGGGNWKALGPETKKILFRDPNVIEGLEQYYAKQAKLGPLLKLEPAVLFDRMTARGGTHINLMQDIAEAAPEQKAQIMRTFVEGLLDRVTREGDIQKVQGALDTWLKLDPKTKATLAGTAKRVQDFDNLFFGFKRMVRNPNPSGSGLLGALNQMKGQVFKGLGTIAGAAGGGAHGGYPGGGAAAGAGFLAGAGAEYGTNAALARLLFNQKFIDMLNRGVRAANQGDSAGARLSVRSIEKLLAAEQAEPPQEPPEGPQGPQGGPGPQGPGGTPPRPFEGAGPAQGQAGEAGSGPAAGETSINKQQHFEIQKLASNELRETEGQPEGWREKLNQASDRAQERIDKFWKDQGSTLQAGPPLHILADYSIVGARKILDGAEKFTDWSKNMVDTFGQQVQPHLRSIWKEAQHIAGVYGWGPSGTQEMPLGNRLTVKAGPVAEDAPVIAQNPRLHLVQKSLDNLDQFHQRNPAMFAGKENYIRGMNELFQPKSGRVPIPPENLISYSSDGPALGASIDEVTPGQRALASEGLREAAKTREAYKAGKVTPIHSALYFAWGALSPGLSPYPQEAGFLHAVDGGLGKWIDMASKGKFDEFTLPKYLEWSGQVLKDSPGAQATANLNTFGRQFLMNAGKPVENGPYKGMRTIDALHAIIGDPDLSVIEARRRYQQINNGLGIDNKVFSFILLVTGHPDTLVADRVRINDFWNAPELEKQGLAYTTNERGEREPTRNLYDNGLNQAWNGVTGLGMYEAAEKGLADRIRKAYADRGVKDGTLGRWHWETWLAKSGQEVSHGSLGAIAKMGQGMPEQQAVIGEGVRQGKYNDLSYGVRYERTPEGYRYKWEKSDGSTVALTQEQQKKILETLRDMRDKKQASGYTEKDRVIPYGTKTSEAREAPWRELPGVNKQALDRILDRLSGTGRLVAK